MPRDLFVDTSGWYTLAGDPTPSRARVESALRDALRLGARVVTTNLVIAETHILILRRAGRDRALRFLEEVVRSWRSAGYPKR